MGLQIFQLRMIVDPHALRPHKVGYTELMSGLRLYGHSTIRDSDRQRHCTCNGFVRQSGIKGKAGEHNIIVYSIGQVHAYVASHGTRMRIYSPTLGRYITGDNDTSAIV